MHRTAALFRVGIVAHTSRATAAKALQRAVRADFISIDNGLLGCDDNHELVQHHLSALPATWSVVLEDDAVPAGDLREQLSLALPMAPSPLVSLYYGRKRPPHWQKRMAAAHAEALTDDANWIIGTNLLHAVGYAIRTELLPSLLDYTTTLPVDQHISQWAKTYGHLISYTHPSLVDHADLPTVVNHPDGQPRTLGRTAWTTGTRNHWTTKAVMLR